MTIRANSAARRDIAYHLHPYTNAKKHEAEGPLVLSSGKGVTVRDDEGREYIEGLAGLWCVSLGWGEERLVEAAARQMRQLGTYHIFAAKSHEPGIELAERLLAMAGPGFASGGKVFFTLGGVNYVCSGSAVSSGNKDVVLTAGHCVNEGPGAFATNWAFVPAYDDGARPYGTFTARQLTTTTQWQNSGDFDYDVAFAVLNTLNGAHLTDVVGGQSIGFNQPRGQYMYSFGYPAANPYDGSDIAWCHGTVVQDTFGGSSDQGLDCNLTGGSSGGPWFVNYSESTGVGVLNSVNSFKYRGGSMRNYMFGPYLGDVAQTLYSSAASL